MYNGYDPAPPYCNRVAFFDEENVEHVYREHRTEVTTRLAERMMWGNGGGGPALLPGGGVSGVP